MPNDSVPIDTHEWISFEDDHTRRTWVFDATFLRSRWSCIFGAGCQGVLDSDAAELSQGCCSYGAHFVDEADVQTVVVSSARLSKRHWQFKKKGKAGGIFDVVDGVTTTRLVDDACIFLNRPGFEGGTGCAFHIAALEAGERPMDWKPDVCWQLPLRLEEHTDDHGYVTSTLREWKRRDWGPGGAEFHWWCTETDEAFVGAVPAYVYLRDEIVEMVGAAAYDHMVELIERPQWTPLPHPATRRRTE
ncbi:MAG: hypothetical protein WCC60_12160 [Ilumatobacteraceae bacterium]